MSRQRKFKQLAVNQALKSKANYRHGALVVKGNRVYPSGFNNSRNKFLNKYDCCQHAEMDAITKFINSHVRRNPTTHPAIKVGKTVCIASHAPNMIFFSKFTVWCVRISEYKSSNDKLKTTSSGPCIVCLKRMRELGFGKVAFSNKEGEIEIHKLKNYDKISLTSSQRLRVLNRDKIKIVIVKLSLEV